MCGPLSLQNNDPDPALSEHATLLTRKLTCNLSTIKSTHLRIHPVIYGVILWQSWEVLYRSLGPCFHWREDRGAGKDCLRDTMKLAKELRSPDSPSGLCVWCQEASLQDLRAGPLRYGLTSGWLHGDRSVSVMIVIECLFHASAVPGWLVSFWILPIKLPLWCQSQSGLLWWQAQQCGHQSFAGIRLLEPEPELSRGRQSPVGIWQAPPPLSLPPTPQATFYLLRSYLFSSSLNYFPFSSKNKL